MNNILIYTFRTFPYVEDLKTITKDIVILGKLKTDIKEIEKRLLRSKYSLVLGVAISNHSSAFETRGVNQFNKNKIQKNGIDSYSLNYPEDGYKDIKINDSFTTSFCNWSIYQISKFIEKQDLKIHHSFVHIKGNNINLLSNYLKEKYS